MAKTYEAGESTLKKLLDENKDLRVPPFQRGYSWGKDEISELFADAVEIDWQKLKSKSPRESHFMGALVFCNAKDESGKNICNILDGQQRLTTLTMMVSALARTMQRIAAGEKDQNAVITKSTIANGYLSPIFKELPSEESPGFLVLQPQADDLLLLNQFTSQNFSFDKLPKKASKRPISKAYDFICTKIEETIIKKAPQYGVTPFEALRWAVMGILETLSFVVIIAKDETAAFTLFETLNDRGLDLSAADLIKNKLFQVCVTATEREAVKDCWKYISDRDGVGDDLVAFFRTKWLSDNNFRRTDAKGEIKNHEFVRKDGLFSAYSDYFDQHKHEPGFIIRTTSELNQSAELLSELISPNQNSPHKEALYGLRDLGAKTCRPLLLSVASGDPKLLSDVIEIIESLTMRWTVAKMVTNQLEVKYAQVASEVSVMFRENKGGDVLCHIKRSLGNLDVPQDEKFSSEFKTWSPANTSKLARYVLSKINAKMTGKELIVAGSNDVHVEHIFPQSPSAQAVAESEISTEDAEAWSGLIGNLTLLDAEINMSIKNAKFSDKLTGAQERNKKGIIHSKLQLNESLKAKQRWRKEDIEQRSEAFASLAVGIWAWKK